MCASCEHWAYLVFETQDMCWVESLSMCFAHTSYEGNHKRGKFPLRTAPFALPLNNAHVLHLNLAYALPLNMTDILALNKANDLRLNILDTCAPLF